MVNHAGLIVDPSSFSKEEILHAIGLVDKGGQLDVVVQPVPQSVEAAEAITRKLYEYAPPRPSDLDYTVVFSQEPYQKHWERTVSLDTDDRTELVSDHDTPAKVRPGFVNKYSSVAVGGTFDHLHWGHRLMLTLSAYMAQERVIVGVTSTELLVNKKYAEALDSYEVRTQAVRDFVTFLRPDLDPEYIQIFPLRDMYGPTASVEDLDALVVSAETFKGGEQVNQKRVNELHWNPLDIVCVGLISNKVSDKLSSTDLRREDLEKQNRQTREAHGSK